MPTEPRRPSAEPLRAPTAPPRCWAGSGRTGARPAPSEQDPHGPGVLVARARPLGVAHRLGMGAVALGQPLPIGSLRPRSPKRSSSLAHDESPRRGAAAAGAAADTERPVLLGPHQRCGQDDHHADQGDLRSTTVTMPKSRSIRMSEAITPRSPRSPWPPKRAQRPQSRRRSTRSREPARRRLALLAVARGRAAR